MADVMRKIDLWTWGSRSRRGVEFFGMLLKIL